MNIFISGTAGFGSAKKITKLPSIVITKLNIMIEKGYNILIGDCQGIDTLVQEYLYTKGYENVTVYCSGSRCRNLVNTAWNVKHVIVPTGLTGRAFFGYKDEIMAQDADGGLAIWDGESAGTGKNIDNLSRAGKYVLIYRTDTDTLQHILPHW